MAWPWVTTSILMALRATSAPSGPFPPPVPPDVGRCGLTGAARTITAPASRARNLRISMPLFSSVDIDPQRDPLPRRRPLDRPRDRGSAGFPIRSRVGPAVIAARSDTSFHRPGGRSQPGISSSRTGRCSWSERVAASAIRRASTTIAGDARARDRPAARPGRTRRTRPRRRGSKRSMKSAQAGPAGGGTPGSTECIGVRGPRPTLIESPRPEELRPDVVAERVVAGDGQRRRARPSSGGAWRRPCRRRRIWRRPGKPQDARRRRRPRRPPRRSASGGRRSRGSRSRGTGRRTAGCSSREAAPDRGRRDGTL